MMDEKELKDKALAVRRNILKMITYSKSSHIGSCLSIVEILTVLYFRILNVDPKNPGNKERDRFILSKAHGSAALYAVLAEKGFFPKGHLDRFFIDGGLLPGHLDMESVPGVEISGGSLGHGLSIGVGMAVADRNDRKKSRIYVLLGDGECNEGAVWEAAMLASTLKLDNITAIIDYNKLQSFGRTNEVIDQKNMRQRWEAFGWQAYEVEGHDFGELIKAFDIGQTCPKVIIAHTVKGKGISFMENKLEWHYKSPNSTEYELALKELETGR